jgi:hypothetical protein
MAIFSRRAAMTRSAAILTAVGSFGARASAQLVYRRREWKQAGEFDQLTKTPVRMRQLFDVTAIEGAGFLVGVKNSLNGLEFGFGIAPKQIQVAVALHQAANALNFDDAMWEKYHLGESLKVEDPATRQPAIRNAFYPSKALKAGSKAPQDPDNPASSYQDTSLEGLYKRGVRFLCCHTATEMQARMLVRRMNLKSDPEDVVKDLLAHTLPGVIVVPAMVAAIAVLQTEGHYSYLRA